MSNTVLLFCLIVYAFTFILGALLGMFTCWEYKITNKEELKEWLESK